MRRQFTYQLDDVPTPWDSHTHSCPKCGQPHKCLGDADPKKCGGWWPELVCMECVGAVPVTVTEFRPPLMTTVQRNALVALTPGLVVDNTTTGKREIYTGPGGWQST